MKPLEQFALETAPILMRDPLAEFLGFRDADMPISYSLEDVGRYSGHLCPTVATAFEMTREALRRLYSDTTPVRGELRVTMASAPDKFANGPFARVIGFITGAARDDGFRGIAGQWSRQNLLLYDEAARPFGSVLFERLDTGASVRLAAKSLPPSGVAALIQPALAAAPTPDEPFQAAWKAGVEAVLNAGRELFDQV